MQEPIQDIQRRIAEALKPVADLSNRLNKQLEPVIEDFQLRLTDWPALPRKENIPDASEAWEFYSRLLEESPGNWQLLEAHLRWYDEQINLAEAGLSTQKNEKIRRRIGVAKVVYDFRRLTLRRLMRAYMLRLKVPVLSASEAVAINEELSAVLTGYRSAEHLVAAFETIRDNPDLDSFKAFKDAAAGHRLANHHPGGRDKFGNAIIETLRLRMRAQTGGKPWRGYKGFVERVKDEYSKIPKDKSKIPYLWV